MHPLVSPAARPAGVAQAAKQKAADEAFTREQAAGQSLRAAQSRKARGIKIEQLARREPMIRELLEEHTALRSATKALNAELDQLRAELADVKEKLASALKPKR